MRTWQSPNIPQLPVQGPAVVIHDTKTGMLVTTNPQGPARMYVCGITPYDSTHLGHAATYVGFDLLNRAWRNAGHDVNYVQNVTDVDDPLFERARVLGTAWDDIALSETERFRNDMVALRVIPPTQYVGVSESIALIVDHIELLEVRGSIYRVGDDLYSAVFADPAFGEISGLDPAAMREAFAQGGGDPARRGKHHPLDSMVWRGQREGEPSWNSPWGPGRPGWHIGCAAIAQEHLAPMFDVQGGGRDLVFPHHEMTAGLAHLRNPRSRFACTYAHAGMVAYDGEKMSKSRGNLVFVSTLLEGGADPVALRLALLRHHYRTDWEWDDAELADASTMLASWRRALALDAGAPTAPVVEAVLGALAADLDTPAALTVLQDWIDKTLAQQSTASDLEPSAATTIRQLMDAALGLSI